MGGGGYCAWADVAINETTFPNETFRSYVSENFDTDSDNSLSEEEISAAEEIYMEEEEEGDSNSSINDFTGIEHLTSLKSIYAPNATITAINLTQNTQLKEVILTGCTNLTELDLSQCPDMSYIDCYDCSSLATLNIVPNSPVSFIDIEGTNITALDVSALPRIISGKSYSASMQAFGYDNEKTTITCTVPKFYAKNLALDGSLGMNFYMEFPDISTVPTDSKMDFTIGAGKSTLQAFNEDFYITDYLYEGFIYDYKYDPTKSEEGYTAVKHYGFRCDATSIEMADTIHAEFTYTDTDSQIKTVSIDYTVTEYLDTIIDDWGNQFSGNAEALAAAVKDYGHYAQITLQETNANYGEHVDIDMARENDYTEEEISDVTEAVSGKVISKGGFDDAGFSLRLDSKTTLLVYLPATATAKADGATITTQGDNLVVAFPDISAHELSNDHTITVTSGGNEYTVTLSAMSYIHNVLNMTQEQQAAMNLTDSQLAHLKNAVVALYKYYEAEYAYKADPNG